MGKCEAGASWREAGYLPDSSSSANSLTSLFFFLQPLGEGVRAEWTDCKMDALCSTIPVCLKSWQGCYLRTCPAQLATSCG